MKNQQLERRKLELEGLIESEIERFQKETGINVIDISFPLGNLIFNKSGIQTKTKVIMFYNPNP